MRMFFGGGAVCELASSLTVQRGMDPFSFGGFPSPPGMEEFDPDDLDEEAIEDIIDAFMDEHVEKLSRPYPQGTVV